MNNETKLNIVAIYSQFGIGEAVKFAASVGKYATWEDAIEAVDSVIAEMA